MLLELRVENYAVIDHAVVEFGRGLNLLTGETGAGKSILIGALALLLGDKASSDVVRHGTEKAVVSGVFDCDARAEKVLEANGIDCDSDQVIVRREIAAGGKGRVFVNNQPATVAVLRQLAPTLAVIHAQNEAIMAFDAAARLELLDAFAAIDTNATAESFSRWRALRDHIAELEHGEQDRLRLVDLWSFQSKEISDAKLQSGEDQQLESEKKLLANAEKIFAAAMAAHDALYDATGASAATIRNAIKQVETVVQVEPKFRETLTALESAKAAVEDAAISLRDYAEGIDASPERLAEVEDRLALLDRLKRKYGPSLDDVIHFGDEVRQKLNEVENRDDILKQLRGELTTAASRYLETARAISRKRADSARKLEKLVETEITDLVMKARFKVELTGSEDESGWSADGFDRIVFLIATNPGEPLQPVEKIASGGELSRVMLALKATVESGNPRRAKSTPQRTMVFDEIDTGIGGRAAEAVGKKLKSLSRTAQVLCITHLPQIASFADQHFVVEKRESAGRTKTGIKLLENGDRTRELARMLSGAKLTDTSLKHAEQLLKANA